MAVALSPESLELLKMLADRQWRLIDEVKTDLMARIPPGRALRAHEVKEQARFRKYGDRKHPERSIEEKLETGRLVLAGAAIHSMNKNYTELRSTEDGHKEIRLRLNVNPFAPKEPKPETPTRTPAKHPGILMTEEQVRDLILHTVGGLFDEFQSRLEPYLQEAFSNVERTVDRAVRHAVEHAVDHAVEGFLERVKVPAEVRLRRQRHR